MGKTGNSKNNKIRKRNNSKGNLDKIRSKLQDLSIEKDEVKPKKVKHMKDELYEYNESKKLTMIISNKEYAPDYVEPKVKNVEVTPKTLTLEEEITRNIELEKQKQKKEKEAIKAQKKVKAKKIKMPSKGFKIASIAVLVTFVICLATTCSVGLVKKANAERIVKEQQEKDKDKEVERLAKLESDKKEAERLNETLALEELPEEGVSMTFLGDMIVANIDDSVDQFSMPFKDIAFMTSKADYTVSILSSVLTSGNIGKNMPSEYILPEEAVTAFTSLGVNVVNLATNTILDYGEYMVKSTSDILKDYRINSFGYEDSTIYLEKNGIRIAIIAYNDVVSGTRNKYESAKISMYSDAKVKEDVAQAKRNADIVIVTPHYGNSSKNEITEGMEHIAKKSIDAGADMVVGSHALGVLPVEMYKGKPIIYSIGCLIAQYKSEIGKQSATFDININSEKQIDKIVINPIYLYSDREVTKAKGVKLQQFISRIKKGLENFKTPHTVLEDRIIIDLKAQ